MTQCSTSLFDGQTVFCGFDVHKKSWEVCIRLNGKEIKTFHATSDVLAIIAMLRKQFPGAAIKSVYEAGFCGFHAHRCLVAAGVDNIVVNPADVPTNGKERSYKSDVVDCRKLARSLENGDLKGIDIPSVELERMRSLVRRETQIRDAATRCCNQLKGAMLFHGNMEIPHILGKRVLANLERQAMADEDFEMLSYIRELREHREERKRLIEAERSLQKKLGYDKDIELLMSIPGFGFRSSTVFQAEIGDISRFSSRNKLAAYVGLSPHVTGSGEKEQVRASGFRKKKQLHYLLIQAAWVAIGRDTALCAYYGHLVNVRHMKKTRAIISVARKLLFIAFAVLRDKVVYSGKKLLDANPELVKMVPNDKFQNSCEESALRAEYANEEDYVVIHDDDYLPPQEQEILDDKLMEPMPLSQGLDDGAPLDEDWTPV